VAHTTPAGSKDSQGRLVQGDEKSLEKQSGSALLSRRNSFRLQPIFENDKVVSVVAVHVPEKKPRKGKKGDAKQPGSTSSTTATSTTANPSGSSALVPSTTATSPRHPSPAKTHKSMGTPISSTAQQQQSTLTQPQPQNQQSNSGAVTPIPSTSHSFSGEHSHETKPPTHADNNNKVQSSHESSNASAVTTSNQNHTFSSPYASEMPGVSNALLSSAAAQEFRAIEKVCSE
jgi:hypothetical protein